MPTAIVVAAVMVFAGVRVIAGAPGTALGLITVTGLLWPVWRWCRSTTSDSDVRDDRHST